MRLGREPCGAWGAGSEHPADRFRRYARGVVLALILVPLLAASAAIDDVDDSEPGCLPGEATSNSKPGCLPGEATSNSEPGCLPGEATSDDEEPPPYLPGLNATYEGSDGKPHVRIDDRIAFVFNDARPDPRLPAGTFRASWRGHIFASAAGKYNFFVHAAGSAQVHVDGKLLVDMKSGTPAWSDAGSIELPFGRHRIEVTLNKSSASARISLYWSGPQFSLEPVGAQWLMHDAEDAPDDRFGRGADLVAALRCAACHEIPGQRRAAPGPSLGRLAGNLNRSWIERWLSDAAPPAGRRMPHFSMKTADAADVAAYLTAEQPKSNPRDEERADERRTRLSHASTKRGRELFFTLGCIACHRIGEVGNADLFGGGDLSQVAAKRPRSFFDRWLADPASINPHHRMPVFSLPKKQRADLAEFLSTQRSEIDSANSAKPEPAESANKPESGQRHFERGRHLVVRYRCAACHELPGGAAAPKSTDAPPVPKTLAGRVAWEKSCCGDPGANSTRPGYALNTADSDAVRGYVAAMGSAGHRQPVPLSGRAVMRERNCAGCHARGRATGLASTLQDLARHHPEFAARLPKLAPPSLESVGDKLHEAALRTAITRPPDSSQDDTRRDADSGVLRPWLDVRMPRFPLSQEETDALVEHLVTSDRVAPAGTPDAEAEHPIATGAERLAAGHRLVTSAGFGCTSCHQIGDAKPIGAAPHALGPDLSMLGNRIRRRWFDRWVRNPSRIVPRMEMPSVQVPVHGVLSDRLDDQLAAVWNVLNEKGFNPPKPGALRIVRQSNVASRKERAEVLTDILRVGRTTFEAPLLIGLPNRHNVLVDLQRGRLARWSIGDVAHQRTEGKSWYWDAAGGTLLAALEGSPDVAMIDRGREIGPRQLGQRVTEIDELALTGGGARVRHRLHFPPGTPDGKPRILTMTQHFTPLWAANEQDESGFRRRVEIAGLPAGSSIRLRLLPARARLTPGETRSVDVVGARGKAKLLVRAGAEIRLELDHAADDAPRLNIPGDSQGRPISLEVDYVNAVPVDRFPNVFPDPPAPAPIAMNVVAGYDAVQLPLPTVIMPTSIAWRGDATMVFSSLEGRVWTARDTDGDGLEDRLRAFSHELAAPYGVIAHEKAVDVANKYALLRLHDDDDDGRADRTVTLASGWGHTADYHDWAVGLVRDDAGAYYIALPCQQDRRSKSAAKLRGHLIRLEPVRPTRASPHPYRVRSFCAGLRFPMGLAIDRKGDLFATDNQGNYNPFNELNHLQSGARYGFINSLERRPGFQPASLPPAINLPHPWTRSVNGICFLYAPQAVSKKMGPSPFGPWEGHLIGCEYDTRRLVRMSLERVGGAAQGAVYPMSLPPEPEKPGLEGPVCCAVSPSGDLYVGNIRDSGWGGGRNTGSIVRLRPKQKLPAGIAEVRAMPQGFHIRFSRPMDRNRLAAKEHYSISSYRRTSTPAYGGEDQDRREERIVSVAIDRDASGVRIVLPKLREGFVYEIHVRRLAGDDEPFFPAEAHYTLHRTP